jgi:hypothetical protein
MAKASPALQVFSAGELSENMDGRTDIEKYPHGCHVMENFQATVQGPAMRRPGTVYVGTVKDQTTRTWLRRFQPSATSSFQVEFGDHYCRFYTNHAQVPISALTGAWVLGAGYAVGATVSYAGRGYSCLVANTASSSNSPAHATFWHDMGAYSATMAYEIYSPYGAADLINSDGAFALQLEQSADVMYCTGAGLPPYKLEHFDTAVWTFVQYAPIDGPFQDQNSSNIALYIFSTITAGNSVPVYNIRATKPLFSATDDSSGGSAFARLLRLDVQYFNVKPWSGNEAVTLGALRRFNGNTYLALNSATTGPNVPTQTKGSQWDGATGVEWLYQDSGYGIGKIIQYVDSQNVQVQVTSSAQLDQAYNFPLDVFGTVKTITGVSLANPCVVTAVAHGFSVGDPVFITGVNGTTQINDRMFVISAVAANTFTLSGINSSTWNAYTSGGTAIKNATLRWQLGEWSDTSGYPTAVGFDSSDRLFFGGGIKLWGSVPGSYESHTQDFNGQVTTDAAINVACTAQEVSSIVWIRAANVLLIGTNGGEFGLGPITTTTPLGPDNVRIVRQSFNRCRAMDAKLIGTSVFYVQRAGKRVMAMDYNFYIDKYESTNLNRMAQFITRPYIFDWTWCQEPFQTLWCARADGQLLGFTFDREDQVTGWHRHLLGGDGIVESVSSIADDDSSHDELWMIVRRTINGVTTRYIEYIHEEYQREFGQSSAFYVDAGITYNGVPTTTITGLSHLEGQSVAILLDGGVHPVQTVTGGAITLQYAGSVANVGLPYTSKLVTMRIDAGQDTGTAQGKTKRIAIATIRLLDSLPGYIGMEGEVADLMMENNPAVGLSTPAPFITGDIPQMSFPGDWETDCRVQVTQPDPGPMTLVAMFPYMEGNEPQ